MTEALKSPGSAETIRHDPRVQSLISTFISWQSPPDSGSSLSSAKTLVGVAEADGERIYGFLGPAQNEDELGRLGAYRVLRLLGSGGMGMVFQAEDELLGRMVALKVMKPELATRAENRERFRREARAAALVEHDHIVPIYHVGEDYGMPFLAMPLLSGSSLDARLQAESLDVAQVIELGRQMAEGLTAAHEHGLVHRDIKPANIWIETGGRVRILDFGLARTLDAKASRLTQEGVVVGTPAFMAPEQANEQTVDHRCDLFSLGSVLYLMCTRQLPFPGKSTLDILMALVTQQPTPPSELNPAIPHPLSELVMHLLAKEPEQRISSAQEVACRLAAIAKMMKESSGTLNKVVPRTAPTLVRPGNGRRSRIILTALFALVGLGLGVLSYQLYFRTEAGTLVVEVDKEADVRFQQGELRIHDAAGKLLYSLKPSEKNKSLPAGKYLIDVAGAEGVKLETDRFEIVRNGQATVRVTVDRSATDMQPTASNKDTDRTLAEWAIALGGKVGIQTGNLSLPWDPAKLTTVAKAAMLPSEPYLLRYVVLSGMESVSDETLLRLQSFTPLRGIDLSHTKITDHGLALLGRMSKLEYVHLDHTHITDSGLAHLVDLNLIVLLLQGTPISSTGMSHVGSIRSLELLDLGDTAVSDSGIEPLSKLSRLWGLQLNNTKVSDNSMNLLQRLPKLDTLDLRDTKVSDAALTQLEPIKRLRTLRFRGQRISDAGLKHLRGFTQLEVLILHTTEVTGAGFQELKASTKLKALNLHGSPIKDESIEHLKVFNKLEGLYLGSTSITDAGLKRLHDFTWLKELDVRFTNTTREGVAVLQKALPKCRIEHNFKNK